MYVPNSTTWTCCHHVGNITNGRDVNKLLMLYNMSIPGYNILWHVSYWLKVTHEEGEQVLIFACSFVMKSSLLVNHAVQKQIRRHSVWVHGYLKHGSFPTFWKIRECQAILFWLECQGIVSEFCCLAGNFFCGQMLFAFVTDNQTWVNYILTNYN